ncbi:MAG: M57 family metalloprotease [Bacteroidota bacterium]
MKHFLFAVLLLTVCTSVFLPTASAQRTDTPVLFLIPAPDQESICRLHPVMDELGTFIPPPTAISDPLGVRTSTINVTYIDDDVAEPWPQAAKDAFNYAKTIWENHLDSPVDIEIDAHWSNLGGCDIMQGVTLGAAGPTFVASWVGSPIANTTYPIGLVNALFGSDQAPGSADVNASFNKDCDDVSTDLWYLGTDGSVPSGKIDFVSVVLHELGHGLGFAGSASYDDGVNDTGSGGTNNNECNGATGAGCFSATPNVYDRFIFDAASSGTALLDTGSYPDNSTTLGTALVSGVGHFSSSSVEANNGGTAAPIFGPNPWEGGSSYSHWDETSYNGSPHALMTPYLSSQEANHSPGALTCALFQDIGWPMGPDCLTLLPVEISNIEAVVDARNITLSWTTASETNNARFEIEVQQGSTPFTSVGFIAGAGTTDESQSYEHTFEAPAAGIYTLRLKQIDFDGTFAYSKTVNVQVALEAAYAWEPAYPNPFNPTTQFGLHVAVAQEVTIQVVDMTGRIVATLHQGQLAAANQHRFAFEASTLPSGTYWIRVIGETFQSSQPAILLK